MIALVAVDGRRGESRRRAGMREQAGEIMLAKRREQLRLVAGDEPVLAGPAIEQRLVQVPAASEGVWQPRPAHEADEMTVPPRHLLHGAAEQHHRIGGSQPRLRREGELVLARAQLDFERDERHAKSMHGLAQDFEDRIDLVETRLGEILKAVRGVLDRRRLGGPGEAVRRKLRIDELEQLEFDFEAGEKIEARIGRAWPALRDRAPASRTAPACRSGNRCRTASSRCCWPMATRGRSRGRQP